ncbi:DUF488 domain-containing protein [Bosea sp. (in: a-proteobacteria)]|uniref:DUF488 domain-containing protein n=1 Tax=Bosea sp. (in: a-proteobacteria) TaxID=1871050 RepID=UPI002FC9D6E0
MSVRIVRLGTPRLADEGTRIGTVRRVPRGVPKERYASENWFDVWFPVLSPSPDLMAQAKAAESEKDWAGFSRGFKAEMAEPAPRHALDLLAVLSQGSDFSVGCYCENEARCHRSVLRALLAERGAKIA